MKKLLLLLTAVLMNTLAIQASDLPFHYRRQYYTDFNGNRVSNYTNQAAVLELSLKFTPNQDEFYFTINNGEPLVSCWVPNQVDMFNMKSMMFTSSNRGKMKGYYTHPGEDQPLQGYSVDLACNQMTMNMYSGMQSQDIKGEIWFFFSHDKKHMYMRVDKYFAAYERVTQRNTTTNDPLHAINQPAVPMPVYDTYDTYTPAPESSTYSGNSSNSQQGVLVGNYAAFGFGQAYGNTVTHNQTWTIYRDQHGYYVIDPKNHLPNYLRYNSFTTYFDYPVSGYNYVFSTFLGSDIIWFVRL